MSNKSYIQPVILASDIETAAKHKVIIISKERVFKEIDIITHKHTDAHEDFGLRTTNAVSSDVDERIDAVVITRFVEFRDAQIRLKMQNFLDPAHYAGATDYIDLQKENYIYPFFVEAEFNDNVIIPLTEYIHRYLVYGALYDWYSLFGLSQAGVYGSQLQTLEDQISSIVRGPSIAQRPLQPFGPQKPL